MNTEAVTVVGRCYDQLQQNMALPPSVSDPSANYKSMTPGLALVVVSIIPGGREVGRYRMARPGMSFTEVQLLPALSDQSVVNRSTL
jgi:hypothetical protein